MSAIFLWKILFFSALLSLGFGLSPNVKKFSKCNIGQHLNHKDRNGRVKLLICAEKIKGVSQWKFVDGSPTLGEIFNPARDCPDVVDRLPEAKDGFYWIVLNNGVHKVWCDVHTDHGGFTLVGMKDSPVSWTVPSNSTPVDPQGPPQWSSIFGDVKVLDFRVQFSTDKTFEGTKADWLYRLNSQRKFGNLFSAHNNGCPYLQAGIGNISFVKDLMTQSDLSNNFTCSKFGPNTHPNLGWGRMNYCLQNDCKYGYAIFSNAFKFRYDKYGSYSFSAISPYSGMNHDSTAFVGCDQDKCCACFGPKGGRQNYCGPKCTAINGGTVMKKAFVWFWVRPRMPQRLWKRCMEFTMKNSAGNIEKYFIDPQTGTAHKGSCSKQFSTFLNEGTLTASDKKSLEKIPNVPGLLSYREDNKQLYVNQGSKWQALSNEQEVLQLNRVLKLDVEFLKKKINSNSAVVNGQLTHLKKKIVSQEKAIRNQGKQLEEQNKTIEKDRNKIEIFENKTRVLEKEIQILKNKTRSQENEIQVQKIETKKQEDKYKDILKRMDILHPPVSCSILKKKIPSTISGKYYINPKAQSSSMTVQVYCDMTDKNGVGVTEIGHDSESSIKVDGYEAAGRYSRKIKYDPTMDQIVAIISGSKNCEQFVKYRCYNAGFWFGGPTSWWVSRTGSRMRNWGGAKSNSRKCACGVTSSCIDRSVGCNCDQNNNVWTEDSGYLIDKSTLPVTELRFGDTSTFSGNNEIGYHTIGKLRCWA